MVAYLVLTALFLAPLAARGFVETFHPDSEVVGAVRMLEVLSPFAAAFRLPLHVEVNGQMWQADAHLGLFGGHLAFSVMYNLGLLWVVILLLGRRWRVGE